MTNAPEPPAPTTTPDHPSPPERQRATVREHTDIAAPIERVFDALVDPARLAEWCRATPETPLTEWRTDARPGGRWEGTGRDADGRPVRVGGTYTAVEPPRRLETTWESDDGAPSSVVRFDLERAIVGGRIGTRVTVTHTSGVATTAVASTAVALARWRAPLNRLATLLARAGRWSVRTDARLAPPSIRRPATRRPPARRPRHVRRAATAGAPTL